MLLEFFDLEIDRGGAVYIYDCKFHPLKYFHREQSDSVVKLLH